MKRFFTMTMLFAIIAANLLNSQTMYRKAVPFYMKPDFDKNTEKTKHLPLFGKVKHTYVPPEILKYYPPTDKILSDDGFELVNISPGNNAQSETWIAINPTDPNNIIATANDNAYMWGEYKMSAWFSTDGGKTWAHRNTPKNKGVFFDAPQSGSMTIFDPGIGFDSKGNAIYCYGFTQLNSDNKIADDNGVFIVKSTNKGSSWDGGFNGDPISAVAVETGNNNTQPFHDRYTMTVDINQNSPYKDNIYVAWQKFKTTSDGPVIARSTDGGVSFSSYTLLGTGGTQSPVPAVGPNGEVYVVWQNRSDINTQAIIRRSDNGGLTWANSVIAQEVKTVGVIDPKINQSRFILKNKQNMRVSSYPAMDVDRTAVGSPSRGNVYIVQAGRESENGPYGIYMAKSTDKGVTWKKNIRVDNNPSRNDMFFPAISVDPSSGMIAIIYYSSQNDPTNNQGVDVYLSISRDAGNSFRQFRITPETKYINGPEDVSQQDSEGSNIYWGDYTSVAALNGKIFPLFWLPTQSSGHYGSLDLFTALISSQPKPPAELSSQNIDNGSNINLEISWKDPIEDLLGGVLGDFQIEVVRDGNSLGKVNKGVLKFVDNNVVSGQQYKYQLRTVLPSNETSVFAELIVNAGGALQPMPPTDVVAKPNANGITLEWINPSKAIDNSSLKDLKRIDVFNGSTKIASFDVASSNAGQKSVNTITSLEKEKFYKLKLKAVGFRNNKETGSEFSEEVFSFAGAPKASINENFDGTRVPSFTDGEWGITSEKASTAPNSLNQSPGKDYGKGLNSNIIFAPVTVSESAKTFSFEAVAKVHVSDKFIVSISNDFGKTYKDIIWMTEQTSADFQVDLAQTKFLYVNRDFSEYMGDTIYIKFTLVSNTFREDKGVYVDNLNLDNRILSVDGSNDISGLNVDIIPNPAVDIAKINYVLPFNGNVELSVFDGLGNKIADLLSDNQNAGTQSITFNTSNLSSGVYYCKITLNGQTKISPIVISK